MGGAGRILAWCSALFSVATVLIFLLGGSAVEEWTARQLAAPGPRAAAAALIFALLAGDIVLPVPSSLVALTAGSLFGAPVGTLVAGSGLALGALAGLVLARRLGGRRIAARLPAAEYARLEQMLARYAPLVVLLARPVPVLAETSILVAGACGMPLRPLLAPTLLGSFATAGLYAWLGAQAHSLADFLWLFALSCLLPAICWLLLRRFRH